MLQLWSEPFQPMGNYVASAVLNQLGRPDVHPLEVLVREALQNCCDAAIHPGDPVHVKITRDRLGEGTVGELRDKLFHEDTPGLPLAEHLEGELEVLSFADFGTHGLRGPTLAGTTAEHTDFVDFIRNIGQKPDKEFGGGSFGYGKAAFYIASAARTVVVDTLIEGDAGPERRLIGYGIGEQFDRDGTMFTGRHWWGDTTSNYPEPVVGDPAADVAQLLGLPERGPTDFGTTVAVLAPTIFSDDDGEPIKDPMEFLVRCAVWSFWPKLIGSGGTSPTLKLDVESFGETVALPDPRSHPRLRAFVDAKERLSVDPVDKGDGLSFDTSIGLLRPKTTTGRLVGQKIPTVAHLPSAAVLTQGERAVAAGVNHVALLRAAEMVIDYLPCQRPNGDAAFEYAGVFMCEPGVDQVFRGSEPPTHDSWNPNALEDKAEKKIVNVSLREIKDACRAFAQPQIDFPTLERTEGRVPLGEVSDMLGSIFPLSEGSGARRTGSKIGPVSTPVVTSGSAPSKGKAKTAPSTWVTNEPSGPETTEGHAGSGDTNGGSGDSPEGPSVGSDLAPPVRRKPPATRLIAGPRLAVDVDGLRVLEATFEVRTAGAEALIRAIPEVMTNDGRQVEKDPPVGEPPFGAISWTGPAAERLSGGEIVVPAEAAGEWIVSVPLLSDVVARVSIEAGRVE